MIRGNRRHAGLESRPALCVPLCVCSNGPYSSAMCRGHTQSTRGAIGALGRRLRHGLPCCGPRCGPRSPAPGLFFSAAAMSVRRTRKLGPGLPDGQPRKRSNQVWVEGLALLRYSRDRTTLFNKRELWSSNWLLGLTPSTSCST